MSMWKALFKKQLMEVNSYLIQDRKNGKKRSTSGMILLILVYVCLFGSLGIMFYMVGGMLCEPLVLIGLSWLYFVIMGLMSICFGVFGSIFNTYATLYQAKDNEFLLSMPIPPFKILTVRLFGVWMWSLIYEAIVFIPALIVYWLQMNINGNLTFLKIVIGMLLLFVISIFILTLSCILGWVVGKISGKLKNKSIIIVFVSVIFIIIYYFVYAHVFTALQGILANAEIVGEKIRGTVYLFYLMGHAGEGDILSMLLFTFIVIVMFALVCWIMMYSFLKMATTNQDITRVKYKEGTVKVRSLREALLFKEIRRFLSNATYMLNCGLSTLFLPIFGVFVLIKAEWIHSLVDVYAEMQDFVTLVICAGLCTMASMNDITAPSVSLEGKNLWILQSLPVSSWQVLLAKLKLHLLMTEIPLIFCIICMVIVFQPNVFDILLIFLLPTLFVCLSAVFGLTINLKAPNLKWMNEVVPIKQSMGVTLSLFGGWGMVIILSALYFAVNTFLSAEVYLLFCAVLVGIMTAALLYWLKKKGTKILESL